MKKSVRRRGPGLSKRATARELDCSETMVNQLIAAGELEIATFNGKPRVVERSVAKIKRRFGKQVAAE